MSDVARVVERAFRTESGRALATLVRLVGDIDVAEDAVQEAFAEALRTWPDRGPPRNPGAWITTVARNRALDRLRREAHRDGKETQATLFDTRHDDEVHPVADDELRLIFTCAHPALSSSAQVALTLRLVCGLSTTELARAFLEQESTIRQRLTRAKAKIRAAAIPFHLPPQHLLPERVPSVLACIYLVFTEGYLATEGDALVRGELCGEAIRLARTLHTLMPDEAQAQALLALLLLQDSRRAARVGRDGAVIGLDEQDRTLWDADAIREGIGHVRAAARRGRGPYLAQAAIAAAHASARSFEDTEWRVIVAAYDDLLSFADSPIVRVNRAVAVGFLHSFADGLRELDAVAGHPRLRRAHQVPASRADLLRRAGRYREAATEYQAAIELVDNGAIKDFLLRRLTEVTGAVPGEPAPGGSHERDRAGGASSSAVRAGEATARPAADRLG